MSVEKEIQKYKGGTSDQWINLDEWLTIIFKIRSPASATSAWKKYYTQSSIQQNENKHLGM